MQLVVITVKGQGGTPLQFVDVEIRDVPGYLNAVHTQRTGADGLVSAVLPAGDYGVFAARLGYSFELLEVTAGAAGEQDLDLVGTVQAVSPPANPGVCRLYAYLLNQDGTGRAGSTVSVYVLPSPIHHVFQREINAVSDEDGLVYADVVYGTPIRVTFLGRGISREIVVPEETTADLFDLIGATADPFQPVVT